jgi:hypothetical protein
VRRGAVSEEQFDGYRVALGKVIAGQRIVASVHHPPGSPCQAAHISEVCPSLSFSSTATG